MRCILFFKVVPVELVVDWIIVVEDAEVSGGAIGAPWCCVGARASQGWARWEDIMLSLAAEMCRRRLLVAEADAFGSSGKRSAVWLLRFRPWCAWYW